MNIGTVYLIKSNRKGTFEGRLKSFNDEWATFEITKGKAGAMCEYNERETGEEVTVRRSFCSFSEVTQ